jgi:hypothetical protein
MSGPPPLPPSPLAQELPDTGADARLPWSTLLYAIPCGLVAGPASALATAVVRSSSQARSVSHLAQSALWGAAEVGVACLALVLADRVAATAARWVRWALALGPVSLLPWLSFGVRAILGAPSPRPMAAIMLWSAVADALAVAVAGGLLGWTARARSGLLWRLPLVAAMAAVLRSVPLAVSLSPALLRSRYAHMVLTGVGTHYALLAPVLVGAALAAALGLQSARREANAARGAPTAASRARS